MRTRRPCSPAVGAARRAARRRRSHSLPHLTLWRERARTPTLPVHAPQPSAEDIQAAKDELVQEAVDKILDAVRPAAAACKSRLPLCVPCAH